MFQRYTILAADMESRCVSCKYEKR